MSSAKTCYEEGQRADYNDYVHAAARLAMEGYRNAEIAKTLGISYGMVCDCMHKAKKEGVFKTERTYDWDPLHIVLHPRNAFAFREASARYGLTPTQLAQRLIDVVIGDDLLKAVIGDPPKRRKKL